MSAVFTSNLAVESSDQSASDAPPPEIEIEEPRWEPRRVHVPHWVVLGVLALFLFAVALSLVWGLANSTLTYGMVLVGPATTSRLAQIHQDLVSAGAPETALRRLAVAAQPGVNIGDALEALVDTDKALSAFDSNPAVAAAHAELRTISSKLSYQRYGISMPITPPPAPILPTLALPTP